jgi:hypothetical protein
MPVLHVHIDGDKCWPDLEDKMDKIIHLGEGARIDIAALPGGMSSGKTSVALRFDLPDGQVVIAETSLALLGTAVDAFRAKYHQ